MKLQHLLENAHLDALGMLDADEQSQFNKAFASAPPAVRAQIRGEQARVADMGDLLPDVTPSPQLRDRVLAAISAEMLAESAGSTQGSDLYDLRAPSRVSRKWRTAAVGLIGACGVLAVAFINVLAINTQIKKTMAVNDLPKEVTRGLGSEHTVDVLFSQASRRDFFEVVDDSSGAIAGVASVLHNPAWDHAVVAFKDLPQLAGKEYHLVTVDHDGQISEEIASIGSGNDKNIGTVNVGSRFVKNGARLAIVVADVGASASSGRIFMQTRLS
ncbi:MAG: hypothetical protein NTV94_19170 [Planctomycetota bacterium]|nr:hypothetical protein [Planctomycetota bacterium]